MNRRELLKTGGLLTGTLCMGGCSSARQPKRTHNFTFCLNTSTIRGQKLGVQKEIEIAAQAGYDGIEIWVRDVQQFITEGGTAPDLKKLASDLGIKIESAISFPQWIVDDDSVRANALEQAKEEMDLLAQIGCPRIAAPPVGATRDPGLDLVKAAERYGALLELGSQMNVLPQLELWGFSANLHRIGEAIFVAAESGHPDACLLLDAYHIYKGGSDFNGLKMINGDSMHMFHMNDYPADPPREAIKDSDRVYPGDGVAPMDHILQILNDKASPIILSLELFNVKLWEQEPLQVAKTGLEKMKAAVERAVL
jgi:sugar phosphate isomerase/epimerase